MAQSGADAVEPFDFDALVQRASRLAASEYVPGELRFEGEFAKLTYDQYRDLRFERDADPLAGSGAPFGMDLLPPGFLFGKPVNVSVVDAGKVSDVPFTLDALDIGPLAPAPTNPEELAWSGFRIRYPVNDPDVFDEVAVFQGASYFRAVAKGQRYGLSARGLAIDTVADTPEEFPDFTHFWVEMPDADATSIAILALLDSRSVTGAYRYEIEPGVETVMRIRSALFPRRDLDNVGVAPLTSMFLFDASNRDRFDDYRPGVHDSDGLQMITGTGERIYRSLANPSATQVSTFLDEDPTAFGLVQRHREFTDFEDSEVRYELRPGVWVQPSGDWGKGQVQLLEIPTRIEIHDNIAAWWRPAATLSANERHDFDYTLSWTGVPADDATLMRVRDVRIGQRLDFEDGPSDGLGVRQVVIDFEVPDDVPDEPDIDVSAQSGEVANVTGHRMEANGDYRVSFEYDPGEAVTSDIRVQLKGGDEAVSETWMYRWTA